MGRSYAKESKRPSSVLIVVLAAFASLADRSARDTVPAVLERLAERLNHRVFHIFSHSLACATVW